MLTRKSDPGVIDKFRYLMMKHSKSLTALLILMICSLVGPALNAAPQQQLAKATFAGGCFWCMEPPFDELKGVISTTSGYIGGHKKNPTYREVSAGRSGHAEAVQVLYDPAQISYQRLLEVFWHNIDPVAVNRQFCDSGSQYRTGIFYHNEEQRKLAELSKTELIMHQPFSGTVVTEISAADTFYPAEKYHQDYYLKNPVRYKYYRYRCGRDARLEELWGKK